MLLISLTFFRSAISSYIDDNKALMRRMYGNLNNDLLTIDLPEEPKTPASTSLFVRSVRNFGGSRFKRGASEGVIEDFILPGKTVDYKSNSISIILGIC